MFTRSTDENGKTQIEIESKLARKNSKDRILAEVLKDSIQENQKNQLFLYKLYDNGIKKADIIIEWFKDLQIIFPQSWAKALPIRMRKDEGLRDYIGRMLKKMNTGVNEISVADEQIDFPEFAEKYDLSKKLIEDIEERKSGILVLAGKCFIFSEKEKNRTTIMQLMFSHRLNNKEIQFHIDEESDGTQRLVDLLPMLFTINKDSTLYFVDEIDRSLHTKLSQFLLDEFVHSSDSCNQIIFTAHDVNLINLDHFRGDEIWFIDKNPLGESALRPLSDFEANDNQDTLKAYLNGRFGAVPVIRGKC